MTSHRYDGPRQPMNNARFYTLVVATVFVITLIIGSITGQGC